MRSLTFVPFPRGGHPGSPAAGCRRLPPSGASRGDGPGRLLPRVRVSVRPGVCPGSGRQRASRRPRPRRACGLRERRGGTQGDSNLLADLQDGDKQTRGRSFRSGYRGGSSSMGSSSGLFSGALTPTDSEAMAVTVSASSFSHFWASTRE